MTTLSDQLAKDSYHKLIKLGSNNLSSNLIPLETGDGTALPISVSTSSVSLGGIKWPETTSTTGNALTVNPDGKSASWQPLPPPESGGNAGAENIGAPYDFGGSILGKPTSGELVIFFQVGRAFTIKEIHLRCKTAPTGGGAWFEVSRFKGGVGSALSFSISIPGGATTNVINRKDRFEVGDVIRVRSHSGVNSTVSDIDLMFKCNL